MSRTRMGLNRGACSEARIRRRVTVHGRVQGVFFRDSVRQRAQSHGVAGWVTQPLRRRGRGRVRGQPRRRRAPGRRSRRAGRVRPRSRASTCATRSPRDSPASRSADHRGLRPRRPRPRRPRPRGPRPQPRGPAAPGLEAAYPRAASLSAANSRLLSLASGCHWTPSPQRPSAISIASITSSSARPVTTSPSPSDEHRLMVVAVGDVRLLARRQRAASDPGSSRTVWSLPSNVPFDPAVRMAAVGGHQVLHERAAERDVEDLHAAADAEHRHLALERAAHERDLERVALGVRRLGSGVHGRRRTSPDRGRHRRSASARRSGRAARSGRAGRRRAASRRAPARWSGAT